jgi:hypothetical protein
MGSLSLRRALLLATLVIGGGVLLHAETWEVVVTGLNNPRGLAFGPEGALYIAEAGSGGDGLCAPGPEGLRCYGETGSITRYDPRTTNWERVVTGLPSLATEGSFATGPHHVSLQGRGNLFFTIGFGGNPALREAQFGEAGLNFARIGRATPNGAWRLQEDLGAFEIGSNPTGDEIDSNPYGLLALPGKKIVADAGANDLLEISANGRIKALATFPNAPNPWDPVPTSVTVGPDGAYYVSQLTGFPFPVGGANVFRVPAEGGSPTIYASGFTHIVDLAFGPDGSLYVLEIAENGLLDAFTTFDFDGALIRVAPDGTRTELLDGVLFAPGGLAIDKQGAIYVSNNSIFSGTGEVIKIVP